jgi:hypothetical protein
MPSFRKLKIKRLMHLLLNVCYHNTMTLCQDDTMPEPFELIQSGTVQLMGRLSGNIRTKREIMLSGITSVVPECLHTNFKDTLYIKAQRIPDCLHTQLKPVMDRVNIQGDISRLLKVLRNKNKWFKFPSRVSQYVNTLCTSLIENRNQICHFNALALCDESITKAGQQARDLVTLVYQNFNIPGLRANKNACQWVTVNNTRKTPDHNKKQNTRLLEKAVLTMAQENEWQYY